MVSSEARHAAWQTERRFAVRLLPEGGQPTELAGGLTEFLDAFDLAFEWLNREDPARTGSATLAILETCDGVSEEVWTYPPLPGNGGQELTERLGFNPANWAGVPGYESDERKSRLRQRVGATDPRTVEAPWQQIERAVTGRAAPSVASPVVEPEPEAKPESPAEHQPRVEFTPRVEYTPPVENRPSVDHKAHDDRTEPASLYVTARRWILAELPPAWNDQLSRWCLILSGATLWFALGLFDVTVLAPLFVLVPTLWWRRRNREAQPPEPESEDWL